MGKTGLRSFQTPTNDHIGAKIMENRTNRGQTGAYRSRSGSSRPSDPYRRPDSARPRPAGQGRPSPAGSTPPRSAGARRPTGSYNGGRNPQRPRGASDSRGRQDPRRPVSRAPQGSAPRRPAVQHKRPRRKRKISFFAFVVLACVLFAAIYAIRLVSIVGVGTPTFIKNVYIGDVSLAGLTLEQGTARLAEIEESWRSEVYTLTYLDRSWDFSRAMVDADVNYEACVDRAWNLGHVGSVFQRKRDIETYARDPIHLPVQVSYDEAKLEAFIDEICAAIDVDAVDAVVVPDVNQPIVVAESQTGLKVNRDQLKQQLDALITSDEADTALPVETVFPAVNSDDVSFQVIAQFTTDVSFRNRSSRTNVRIALDAYNGLSVLPGQSCSFNEIVGPRDQEHGFKQATEFVGDTTTLGWGGGVCQASTTLYNALIQAGMTIDTRFQHSMTVSYVEPSLDAAVSYPRKDLVFTNNTDYTIYIYTSVTDEEATVTIYGHRPDYRYVLESLVIEENVPSTRETEVEDTEGVKAYYTDERVLHSKGKPGCKSQGWLVAYDWDTGAEVSRTMVSDDNYQPGATVYYVGVHDRAAESLVPTDTPSGGE